jgi:hypothetical protein
MGEEKRLTYTYRFRREGRLEKEFVVELNAETLQLIRPENKEFPEWTRLEYEKCSNCPLNEKDSPRCPAAEALHEPIQYFKDRISYEEYELEIVAAERTYTKTTALQYGASALMGLLMAVSGCPVMGQLKAMARIHLPFSSMEETLYRVISMYLFAQLFEYRKGGKPDWDLKQLVKIYEDVAQVNDGFTRRIKKIHTEDSGLNAIVHLDCYRRFANHSILDTDLKQISRYFERNL